LDEDGLRRETHDVVADDVMIPFLGEELDRKATDVTDGVCTSLFTASGAQTEQYLGLLSNAVEELS
jgi:hypothetical protein